MGNVQEKGKLQALLSIILKKSALKAFPPLPQIKGNGCIQDDIIYQHNGRLRTSRSQKGMSKIRVGIHSD